MFELEMIGSALVEHCASSKVKMSLDVHCPSYNCTCASGFTCLYFSCSMLWLSTSKFEYKISNFLSKGEHLDCSNAILAVAYEIHKYYSTSNRFSLFKRLDLFPNESSLKIWIEYTAAIKINHPYRLDIYELLNRTSSRIVRVAAASGVAQEFWILLYQDE